MFGLFFISEIMFGIELELILYKILDDVKYISNNNKLMVGFLTVYNVILGIEWYFILSYLSYLYF